MPRKLYHAGAANRPSLFVSYDAVKCPPFICLWGILIATLSCPHLASAQTGDVTGIHDPSIVQANNKFYLFCTGWGITERTSDDLFQIPN